MAGDRYRPIITFCDVKLQRLPFYDVLDELIKPTSLASDNSQRFQETCFAFALTPQQVQQVSSSMDISGTKCDFMVQVQLRFCLSETSCPQEDHFPPNLCVKVNGKPCNLPGYLPPTKNGVEPKRPSRPINITSLVKLSTTVPNTIVVSWTSEIGRSYSMAVYLVKQLSSTMLLQRLRAKGIRNPDHSRALIKEKLTADPDSEIATTSLRVSLLCPLGKMRLMIPCRAFSQLFSRELFMEILNSCLDCDEIQFKEDGSWAPMRSKKEVQEVSASYNGIDGGCRTSVLEQNSQTNGNSGGNSKKVEVIDLTLDSSSEEEEDEEPPQKKSCPSLSSISPQMDNGVLNLHRQASPVSRTPSMPQVDTSYIPPPPPLIQDYRHYYSTPGDLSDLSFFPFLQEENHQHYNMVMAAAASASEDHDLLLSRFLPYGSSQLFLDPPSTPVSNSLPPINVNGSSTGSSLVSSSSLRESLGHPPAPRPTSESAPTSAIYGPIPDVISLD
ncbi:E3 SUMO-protein ligase PIAS1-like [Sinocyclocheilus rhinocerous]|uniref:E3 SUMO-protein ligase PIAS1-like n=1 Tax=Sinocyclocheilus rhinocerous TaxID=307959 RepID=UPI0007B9C714|nr:PREDICTED: E3 SUMO-protein ligase PIAS1-like [Sinocyclocheilus rhinocerous]